jgi:hypothetical protein
VVRVLYIAGSGRSGSTIVDNVLGQVDGVASVGEVRFLWERGVLADRLCGCGEPFSACPFWQPVMEATTGRVAAASDADRMAALLARGTRARHVPWLVRARRNPSSVGARLGELPDALAALYAAIAERAGARVIVDSSKLPPYGELLRHVPGVDVSYVHLVRDPRATAYSWSRAKPLPERDGGMMQRQSPSKSAALWTLWNGAAEALWSRQRDRYLRMRYEDVIAEPRAAFARMLALVGEPADGLPLVGEHEVELGTTHGVAGNPSRFTTGTVALRADTEWRRRMRARDRAVVDAISWPLLFRHGYAGSGGPPPRSGS